MGDDVIMKQPKKSNLPFF